MVRNYAPNTVDFSRVKQILDGAVAAWTDRTGRLANLAKHDLKFGWETRDQLLKATAFGLPLIAQEHIDKKTGRDSNLIIALREGVDPYPKMPIKGPFLEDADIGEIIDWINSGAPD